MRRLLLASMVLLGAALAQFSFVAKAQGLHVDDPDIKAIRDVVELYISGDADKIRSAFYPIANLYTANAKINLWVIPLEQFLANVAKGAASGERRPKISVDFIDKAGDAAVVRLTETSEATKVTDYLSLVHSSAGWKVVSKNFDVAVKTESSSVAPKNAQAADHNSCESVEVRTFDFMIGDWASSTSELLAGSGAHGAGVNHIEKALGGCVLLQHRQEERNGKQLFDAYAIFAFDAARSQMRLFVVDDGHAQVYDGIWESGGWAFYRERTSDTGEIWLLRVRYALADRGFTQTAELSKNRGKTWEKASVTIYEPKR
jgi:hypothetical protein